MTRSAAEAPWRVPMMLLFTGSGMALGQKAAELLKSDVSAYRIEVASDTLAMTDFDALKGDRIAEEFMEMMNDYVDRRYVPAARV